MTEPEWWHPLLTGWVDEVAEAWQAMKIPLAQRRAWRRDLVVDLASALADGATLDEFITTAPARFARDTAIARGVVDDLDIAHDFDRGLEDSQPAVGVVSPVSSEVRPATFEFRFVLAAVVGSLLGGCVAMATVLPIGLSVALGFDSYEWAPVLITYAMGAVLAAAGGVGAVRAVFRSDPRARRFGWVTGFGLLVWGAVATAPAVALAWRTGFVDSPGNVTLEVLVVLLVIVVGMWTLASRLRRSSLRLHGR